MGAFAGNGGEMSARSTSRTLAQAVITPPSTPKKVRFGGRECRHFNPEFATPPGPRVAPHGKMDNSRKAPCKERTTFLAGARNPEIPGGGILRHREAEDRRPPGDMVEPEGKAGGANIGPAAGCLPVADSSATQQALLLRSASTKGWRSPTCDFARQE